VFFVPLSPCVTLLSFLYLATGSLSAKNYPSAIAEIAAKFAVSPSKME
jgi:hypothetical protein